MNQSIQRNDETDSDACFWLFLFGCEAESMPWKNVVKTRRNVLQPGGFLL